MLNQLSIRNVAVIDKLDINLHDGVSVLTGETGAGKSILIDAFGVVLGNRASADYIRSGADSFWVQAVFDISGIEAVKSLLAEQGIDEEDELFLRRRILATAKARLQLTACRYHWQYSKASANFWSIFMASMKTRRF